MGTQTVTLESLRRLAELKPPIVGIPRPGERPFAFERRILAQLIKGLDGDTRGELLPPGHEFMPIGGYDWRKPEIAHTPVLVISSESLSRHYKLIGRDMTYYGSNNGAGSLQRNWAQSERAKITGMRTVRTRYGNGTVQVPAKAKPLKRVPAFMYRELREAEKHLYPPPKAERGELFAWLHPEKPRHSRYSDRKFCALYGIDVRADVLAFYRAKSKRQAVGQAVADYFAKIGQLHNFNGLRKRLKQLGRIVDPWSAQPVAIKRGYGSSCSPGSASRVPDPEAQTQFVKTIGYHLRLRKPSELSPWLRAGEQFESPATRHNNAWKECRGACEHVERLRADIKALEAGEVVNFEGQQDEQAQNQ